jgi:hypothetical protein
VAEPKTYGGERTSCPLCDAPVTLPRSEHHDLDGGMIKALVVTDNGTFHAHVRDAHPERWAELVEMQRQVNANQFIGGMPRRVDGTFLRAGEDVGNLGSDLG